MAQRTRTRPDVEPAYYRPNDLSAMLNLSLSAIDRLRKKGELPPPVKIGTRAIGWPRQEIERWIAARSANRC